MKLVAGLGNPGAKYAGNRHNIGFMAVEAMARRHGFPAFRAKFSALVSDGTIQGQRVLLMMPQTYMNESGRAVAEAARFHKIPIDDVLVLHDELDIAPGKIKIKRGGGAAGHNGLRSIDAHLGKDYWRIRLGIGHPGSRERVHGWVLSDFAKADRDWLEAMMDVLAAEAGLLVAESGPDAGRFLNAYAAAMPGAEPKAPGKAAKPVKPEKPAKGAEKTKPETVVLPSLAPRPETGRGAGSVPSALAAALSKALRGKDNS
ncbi:MAG: aminoacyl-tRNA hydrolase [Rhodospirillaceae bacterium]